LAEVLDRFEEAGESGIVYQVVVDAWPEDDSSRVMRVSVTVDGGRVSALHPVSWGPRQVDGRTQWSRDQNRPRPVAGPLAGAERQAGRLLAARVRAGHDPHRSP